MVTLDIKGNEYNRLTAIKRLDEKSASSSYLWECRCECGGITKATTTQLKNGYKKSCGCLRKEKAYEATVNDLSGKKFNKLLVIKDSGKRYKDDEGVLWECLCDCGKTTFQKGYQLTKGLVKGCGCVQSRDLSGEKYGRLTVVSCVKNIRSKGSRHKIWDCVCECGKKTKVSTGSLKSGHTRSCGCLSIEMSTGVNNNNYNPNLTDEDRLRSNRYTLKGGKISKFREGVYERDNYTCQICSARNGSGKKIILNAHHLDGWNWCKEKRFDIDNGITLCNECHSDFHRKYGSGDNTKEQFEEYKTQALV